MSKWKKSSLQNNMYQLILVSEQVEVVCVCVCVEKTWKDMHRILIMVISEGWLLLSIYIVWKFSKELALHL